MAKYPYKILPTSPSGQVYKPLIPVILSLKKTHKITTGIYALIDSGADVCFCTMDIGLWLGINFKNKKSIYFTAANNKEFETKKEIIKLHVGGKIYDCPFYFSKELPPTSPVILGQIGFFDRFKISFDLQNREFEVS
ncbi:retroviral-like aspartic protease [Candidatus Gottesmanbacteria bacterium]|nr:retroviral-like aspartic protease [Candidatus Gottesmanbacteria bacterium]